MRVYLPLTLSVLAAAMTSGEIGPGPITGYAVTPALREWYADGDLEELEYAALLAAARASLRLLHEDPDAPARRVVLAVEVPDPIVRHALDDGSLGTEENRAMVRITEAVPVGTIVSGHIDDPIAEPDVAAAVRALAAADAGDDDARFTVDGAQGHELMWYATQELPYLFG